MELKTIDGKEASSLGSSKILIPDVTLTHSVHNRDKEYLHSQPSPASRLPGQPYPAGQPYNYENLPAPRTPSAWSPQQLRSQHAPRHTSGLRPNRTESQLLTCQNRRLSLRRADPDVCK